MVNCCVKSRADLGGKTMEAWFDETLKTSESEVLEDGSILVYEDGTGCSAGEVSCSVYRKTDGKFWVTTTISSCCDDDIIRDECVTLKDVFLTLVQYSFWDGNKAGWKLAELKKKSDPEWKWNDKNLLALREEANKLIEAM